MRNPRLRHQSQNLAKGLSRVWFHLASGIIVAAVVGAIVALIRSDPNLATAFASLGVAGSVIIAAAQLRLTTRTQQLDFLFKIQEQFFFREELVKIREALDEEHIWIGVEGLTPEDDPPYNPPAKKEDDVVVRADDMDDYLGYLELVALFLDQDLLSIDAAWEFFSHYLEWTLRNENVRYYVWWLNAYKRHTRLYYTHLDPLMERFNDYARRKGLLKA